MDVSSYLTASASLGPFGWTFFIIQIAAAIGGAYLAFMRGDTHPVRGAALQRLGYALLVLGAVGTILGGLRFGDVAPFAAHYWFYLVALFEVVLIVYALVYRQGSYAEQMALFESSRGRGQRGGRAAALGVNNNGRIGPELADGPRPVATTGRRGARRERKRRGK